MEKVASIKIIRVKEKKSESWMNSDILDTINKRNEAFLVSRKSKDQAHLDNHIRTLRNMVPMMIRENKKGFFFCDKITELKSNPKKLWLSLKQTGYSKKPQDKVK